MKFLASIKNIWADFRQLPISVLVLSGTLALLMCLESWQLIERSTCFQPNAPIPIVANLHGLFLPANPNDHNNLNPKVDWIGFEEHLYFCPISLEQNAKLYPIETEALQTIDKALETYTHITDSLDNEQIELLLQPQKDVAAIHSLGLDCGSREHQLLALYYLKQSADEIKEIAAAPPLKTNTNPSYQRTPEQTKRLALLDPTRLLVSLHLLLDDSQHPITPQQAHNVLRRYASYCNSLAKLYQLHDRAISVLTEEQLLIPTGLAPRIWESSSSPNALIYASELIKNRQQSVRDQGIEIK